MTTEPSTLEAVCVGDVAAALDAAEDHAQVIDTETTLVVAAHRGDRQIAQLNLERYEPKPVRPRGTVKALTADGFLTSFARRTSDTTPATVYADIDNVQIGYVIHRPDEIVRASFESDVVAKIREELGASRSEAE